MSEIILEIDGKRFSVKSGWVKESVEVAFRESLAAENGTVVIKRLPDAKDKCNDCPIAKSECELRETLKATEERLGSQYRKQGELMGNIAKRKMEIEKENKELKEMISKMEDALGHIKRIVEDAWESREWSSDDIKTITVHNLTRLKTDETTI